MENVEPRLTVLIVDDQVELALNVEDILKEEGHLTAVAHDGKTALEISLETSFDLAIVDIRLPDISGVDLVRMLNERSAYMDFVIITGYASLDSAVEAVAQKRIVAYELKPLDMKRVLAMVKQIAERRRMEKALQRNRARLRLLLEQVPCILWMTDSDLKLTSSVGAGLNGLQISAADVIGSSIDDKACEKEQAERPVRAHRKALSGIASTYELEQTGRVFHCAVEPFRDVDGAISGVVGLAVDITERKATENQLRMLTRRLVEVQEAERRLIAGELHDQIGQYLTALKMLLHRTQALVGEDCPPTLEQAVLVLTELIYRVRSLSLDLRPQMLDDLGLLPALLWHFQRYTEQTEVVVNFKHSGISNIMPQDTCTAAYRIVQEALNNVARHAGTREAWVHVWTARNRLCLRIEDRGTGFDSTRVVAGAGIQGMRERAMYVGGNFELASSPGAGTRLTAELPLPNKSKRTKHNNRKQKES